MTLSSPIATQGRTELHKYCALCITQAVTCPITALQQGWTMFWPPDSIKLCKAEIVIKALRIYFYELSQVKYVISEQARTLICLQSIIMSSLPVLKTDQWRQLTYIQRVEQYVFRSNFNTILDNYYWEDYYSMGWCPILGYFLPWAQSFQDMLQSPVTLHWTNSYRKGFDRLMDWL